MILHPIAPPTPRENRGERLRALLLLGMIGCTWLALVAGVSSAFMRIDRRPGPERAVSSRWPGESRLDRPGDRPTLVLVAHPKCPCTKATLEQLARILTRTAGPVRGYALFTRPADLGAGWARTAAWDQAAELPGFTSVDDVDGVEALRFGATTSGHVFVYDAGGTLRFSGGLTAARATEGRSTGMTAVLEVLRGATPAFSRTPVFGCPLVRSDGDR